MRVLAPAREAPVDRAPPLRSSGGAASPLGLAAREAGARTPSTPEDAARAQIGAPRALRPAPLGGPVPAGQTVRNHPSAVAQTTAAKTTASADDGVDPAKTTKLGEWIRRMGACGLMCALALLTACSTVSGPASGSAPRTGTVATATHDAARPVSHRQVFAATTGKSTTEKVAYYQDLLASRGYAARLDDSGRATVVGLRKPTSTAANHGNGAYDDGFAVLRKLPSGEIVCHEYLGNTEPCGNTRGAYGVDIDGDGRKDLGCLVPGKLEMCFSTSDGLGEVLRPVGTSYVARDIDWDGDFDEGGRHSAGRSVLFHCGGDGYTSSAACQTLPPDQWRPFWDTLTREARPARIDYFLLVR